MQAADAVHVVGREGEPVVVPGVAGGAAGLDEQVAEQVGQPALRVRGSASPGRRSAGRRRAAGREVCSPGRSASRSRPLQSASTRVPRRRSLIPTLRRVSSRASGRVSGSRASRAVSWCTRRSSGAPRCGEPRVIVSRTRVVQRVRLRRPAAGLVQRAAGDEAAHGVPDEDDVLHRHRPGVHQRAEQRVERAAVLGDVQPGVVAQVDRGQPEVALQLAAVGDRRVAVVPLRAVAPRVLGLGEAVQEDGQPAGRVRERLPQRRGRPAAPRGRPPARSCRARGRAPRAASRSPCAPFRIASATRPGRPASRSPPSARSDGHSPGRAGAGAERQPDAGVGQAGDRVVRRPGPGAPRGRPPGTRGRRCPGAPRGSGRCCRAG